MKIALEIDDEIIRDAIGGARIDYWARPLTWNRDEIRLKITEWASETEEDIRHILLRSDFERALVILAINPRNKVSITPSERTRASRINSKRKASQ